MLYGKTIVLIIPCFNEALGLPEVLGKIPDCVDEWIVVDNGSTDDTAEIAKGMGAVVIHESKRGYGAAYKAGFAVATADIVVTLDGDGTYPVECIESLVGSMIKEELEFISACRFPLQNPESMDVVSRKDQSSGKGDLMRMVDNSVRMVMSAVRHN